MSPHRLLTTPALKRIGEGGPNCRIALQPKRRLDAKAGEIVGKLKRNIKNRIQFLVNDIATSVPQTQHRNPDVTEKLSPTKSTLSMNSSLASLRGSVLKEIDHDTARTAMVTQPNGELLPPGPSGLKQRYIVSTPAICTCHSERKFYVLWPATDGLDKHLNERTYDKLASICGSSSHVDVFDSGSLGVINWRVKLTMEEAEQVSSWPEILSPVGAPQECPARNEGSCKPSREKYIAWGTEDCWNDHEVAMRGARNLLDVVGHCSRMEATNYRETPGHPSGVLYWRIIILDEQIDAVESIAEIREVELENSSFDPHYDVGRPIPNRDKRAMKPSKPRWTPRDMDLVGARMAGSSRFS